MNSNGIRIKRLCLYVALLCIQFGHALDHINPNDSTDMDASVIHHQFANGFTYYLRPTPAETDQLSIEFLVKAGFNQEESEQHALSHFLEHIVLKAGKHESIKMLYGSKRAQELNLTRSSVLARTGRDYTAFTLRIPNTLKAKNFVFRLLKDIMNDVEFKDRYINAERPPFFDESELRGGETSLLRQDFILDSKILGLPDNYPEDYRAHIQSFPKKELIRFYEDWYRPDLMGVVITGGIHDTVALQNELKHWFAPVPEATNKKPKIEVNRRYLKLPHRFIKKERPALYKDTYTTDIGYRLYFRQASSAFGKGEAALENKLMQTLLKNVLAVHYRELREINNWPFRIGVINAEYPAALKMIVNTTGEYEQTALAASITSLQQLKEYGVPIQIFEETKARMLKNLKANSLSMGSYWRSQLRAYFVSGEALPEQKNQLLIDCLQALQAEDLQAYLTTQVAELPEDIGLIAPAGHPSLQYPEKQVRSWLRQVIEQPAEPIRKPKLPHQLLDEVTLKGLKETTHKEVKTKIPGAKEYILDNGLTLILNAFEPSPDFLLNQNMIQFEGINTRGADCFEKKDFYSAINAPHFIKATGIGRLAHWQLKRLLKKKGFTGNVYPSITSTTTRIEGRAAMEDLETALQLVYLYIVQPRVNQAGVNRWKESAPDLFLADINRDDFKSYIQSYMNKPDILPDGTHWLDGLQHTDMQRAYAIYRSLMGNPAEFTFLFSGNFNKTHVLQLCKKYLGNLPSGLQPNCIQTKHTEFYKKSSGQTQQWVAHEKMNNALLEIAYNKSMKSEEPLAKQKAKLTMLVRIMELTFTKEMRMNSKKGGPYGVDVYEKEDMASHYQEVSIKFSAPPHDIKRLKRELKQVVAQLKKAPVSPSMFKVAREEALALGKETNPVMLSKMIEHSLYDVPWYTHEAYTQFLKELSPEDVCAFAKHILQDDPMEFSLMLQNE